MPMVLFLCLAIFPAVAHAQLAIDVVYPRDEMVLSAQDSTFILGSVTPGDANLTINGQRPQVFTGGAFLAYVPVEAGEFIFHCEAERDTQKVTLDRQVTISAPAAISVDSLQIDSSFVAPQEDWELRPGETLEVRFRATPGKHASFRLGESGPGQPMTEVKNWVPHYWGEAAFGELDRVALPPLAGVYTGALKIGPFDWFWRDSVYFTVTSDEGDSIVLTSPGTITVQPVPTPLVGELTEDLTVARTGPGLGYQLFLPRGVRINIDGTRGQYSRARLSPDSESWVPNYAISLLPEGVQVPSATITTVRATDMEGLTRILIPMTAPLPYEVVQTSEPQRLEVVIYGATADTDWIRYLGAFDHIREIRWHQDAPRVYRLRVDLKAKQQWGYDIRYESGQLVLDIRKPPKLSGWPKSPLKGRVICIDPGHGPDLGAVGPTRLTERDLNLEVSNFLRGALEKKGATVVLTREGEAGIELHARPKIAWLVRADLLVSVHANALPDGVNPFKSRGTSVYYYHPQSLSLALSLHRRLLEKLKLHDFGLFYDNLALCRPTQMPAVLVEPAFIMHPEEEALLRDPAFLKKIAAALVEGMEDFFKQAKD